MYEGRERRKPVVISDEQVEAIAERAAEIALEKVYTQVGKSVISKIMWIFGTTAIALAVWLAGNGKLNQ